MALETWNFGYFMYLAIWSDFIITVASTKLKYQLKFST